LKKGTARTVNYGILKSKVQVFITEHAPKVIQANIGIVLGIAIPLGEGNTKCVGKRVHDEYQHHHNSG
jgi:hypothetical protein